MSDPVLDLLGLKCPLPALKTRAALGRARPGERLLVVASDPLAGLDIPNAARECGAVVEWSRQENGIVTVQIRKPDA